MPRFSFAPSLTAEIAGSEGFDCFYAGAIYRPARVRVLISDGAASAPNSSSTKIFASGGQTRSTTVDGEWNGALCIIAESFVRIKVTLPCIKVSVP